MIDKDLGRVPAEPGSREPSPAVSAFGFDPSRDRGIYVGKSWPRAATPCDLVPRWEGEFASHSDWVNFASKRLTVASDSNGCDLKAICVDAFGRRCANGRDMARARDEDAFPVRYFWDCWPASVDTHPEGRDAQQARFTSGAVAESETHSLRSPTTVSKDHP